MNYLYSDPMRFVVVTGKGIPEEEDYNSVKICECSTQENAEKVAFALSNTKGNFTVLAVIVGRRGGFKVVSEY